MTIQINSSNRQKMLYLADFLKSLDFVEQLDIKEEAVKPVSFFDKYNGCLPHLDVAAFDNYLAESKKE